jgi:hypothetical protein
MACVNPTDLLSLRVEDGDVLLQTPGGAARRMAPDMAVQLAQQLVEAAEQARKDAGARNRGKPPFPPSELVSPHAAG